MIDYPEYHSPSSEATHAFILAQRVGRLVTTGTDGYPRLGLYVFHFEEPVVEVHLVSEDAQVADLRANPRALFEVDSERLPNWMERRAPVEVGLLQQRSNR